MKLRLLLQPVLAATFAIRSGLADARAGKPRYSSALFGQSANRVAMLEDGWKSVAKLFVLALILDIVYQIIAMRFVYPGEAITTAVLLAIVPYLIGRGLVTHLPRRRAHDKG